MVIYWHRILQRLIAELKGAGGLKSKQTEFSHDRIHGEGERGAISGDKDTIRVSSRRLRSKCVVWVEASRLQGGREMGGVV